MSDRISPSETQDNQHNTRNDDDDGRRALIAIIFLLFSFGCICCSSQVALWYINEDQVEASLLTNKTADYGVRNLAAAPLSANVITETLQDRAALEQTPQSTAVAIARGPLTVPTATPVPIPTLATLTPTSTPTPTATPPPTSPPPSPTSPPPTVSPLPTNTPLPPATATATPIVPTPTPLTPSPTPIPPPPTLSPTPVTPAPTSPPANNPPQANDDTASTNEDTAVVIDVLGNDSDDDGTIIPGTVTVTGGPANGSVSVNGSTGQITYTPDPNFNGIDTFTYRVCDDDGDCDTATVTVTVTPVNDAPLAVDDATNTDDATPITITVLSNDSDPDNDPLTVISVGVPSSGLATINLDYSITYTPTVGITGTHTFTYTISDGSLSDTATVTVTVTGRPVAVDDAAQTAEDASTLIDVLNNDSDPDNDPLTVIAVGSPANGVAVINAGFDVTYTPNPNFNGTDTFTYTISDGLFTDSATVTIEVLAVNDAPVAVDDSYTTAVNSTLIVPAPGVLGNDFDVDIEPLTARLMTPPSAGLLGFSSDGSFNYTAPTGAGVYTFTYRAEDTILTPSNIATVTISVTP